MYVVCVVRAGRVQFAVFLCIVYVCVHARMRTYRDLTVSVRGTISMCMCIGSMMIERMVMVCARAKFEVAVLVLAVAHTGARRSHLCANMRLGVCP